MAKEVSRMIQIHPIELLRRQYLQLLDPEELTLPQAEMLRSPEIQAQIYRDMFNESLHIFLPPDRYRFRVLKRLIRALEEAIEDPEEDVCHLDPSSFQQPFEEPSNESSSYKFHDSRSLQDISLSS